MNQKREFSKEDWVRIRNALDLYLRCQLGQLKDAFQVFMWEFEERTRDDSEISESLKQEMINRVTWALERAEKEIALTAFGSTSASFGVKSLDDPTRQLIIQADLRRCNFSDDVTKCPDYPTNCSAPTTGWCPGSLSKEVTKSEIKLPYPSTDIKQGKYAVVGYHRDLGGGILVWARTKFCAEVDADTINKNGGNAKVVTKKSALSGKK